jgi:uncharacterized protein YutE (UPF0331/DUF86 family)
MSRASAATGPLEQLADVVRELELVAGHSLQEFRDGMYVRRAAERLVQLAVDLACEMAIAELHEARGRVPSGHEEVFRELGRLGRVDAAMADKMAAAAALRRDLLYAPHPDLDDSLHARLPYLAVLLREYGRQLEAAPVSAGLLRIPTKSGAVR